MKMIGLVILIVGIGFTIFSGYTYYTKEKVVDFGKLEITKDKPHTFEWSPLIGIGLIGLGAVVFWQASKK